MHQNDRHTNGPKKLSRPSHYLELTSSKDIVDLHQKILTILDRMDISDYFFVRIDDLNYNLPLNTYPAALQKEYAENGYKEQDLLLQYLADNVHAIFMSDIYRYAFNQSYEIRFTRINRQIFLLHQYHGFHESYNIPLQISRDTKKSLLTVAVQHRDPAEFRKTIEPYKALLQSLGESINTVVNTQFADIYPSATITAQIGSKELLMLNTLANNDMSLSQVANKLNISYTAANQYIATAKKAFNAKPPSALLKKRSHWGLSTITEHRKIIITLTVSTYEWTIIMSHNKKRTSLCSTHEKTTSNPPCPN